MRTEVRTDRVSWLDPLTAGAAQRQYLQALEELRLAINRLLLLGLYEFEGHLAIYPPGSYYRKHLDQFRDIGSRIVTCVLYLNRDWLVITSYSIHYTKLYDPGRRDPDPRHSSWTWR